MTIAAASDDEASGPGRRAGALSPEVGATRVPTDTSPTVVAADTMVDEGFPTPTAAMVLHRVLARSARTFLLNDMGDELVGDDDRCESTITALSIHMGPRPLWAQSAASSLNGTQRRTTDVERIHQSRVALRRIRSNLRTFRPLTHAKWSTTLRAELAWYGGRLGVLRDLHILHRMVVERGPDVLDPDQVLRLEEVVLERQAAALADIAAERGGARRFQLTEQMMVLWDGPDLKAAASGPATEVLVPLLDRAWHDLRGAARTARKHPTDRNLHKLRVRLKDLRYGCETVALIEGGPARKTAKAAERLQSKLGDLHDACYSIAWLEEVAGDRKQLAKPAAKLIKVQEQACGEARKGWKRDLKDIERRWRRWHA